MKPIIQGLNFGRRIKRLYGGVQNLPILLSFVVKVRDFELRSQQHLTFGVEQPEKTITCAKMA
jgi:hypothetical protein